MLVNSDLILYYCKRNIYIHVYCTSLSVEISSVEVIIYVFVNAVFVCMSYYVRYTITRCYIKVFIVIHSTIKL